MRLQTAIKTFALATCLLTASIAHAQLAETNPIHNAAIGAGGALINKTISKQTDDMLETAGYQSLMGVELDGMRNWEKKYNEYLKNVDGYAKALQATTTLYAQGVKTLSHLYDIIRVVQKNPQGVVATAAMNNLYAEAATELVKVYRTIKFVMAQGGENNMLTGAERTELLFMVADSMGRLNAKLKRLALSISYYNMVDVWNKATAGMIDRNNGDIAKAALERWTRATKVAIGK